MSCTRIITLACVLFWSYFPLIIFHTIGVRTERDISLKLGTLIKYNETMCHAQEL